MRKMCSYWIYYCCFFLSLCARFVLTVSMNVCMCVHVRTRLDDDYDDVDEKQSKAKLLHWEIPTNNLCVHKRFSVICTHCLRFISLLHVFDICAVAQYRHRAFFSLSMNSIRAMSVSGWFFFFFLSCRWQQHLMSYNKKW